LRAKVCMDARENGERVTFSFFNLLRLQLPSQRFTLFKSAVANSLAIYLRSFWHRRDFIWVLFSEEWCQKLEFSCYTEGWHRNRIFFSSCHSEEWCQHRIMVFMSSCQSEEWCQNTKYFFISFCHRGVMSEQEIFLYEFLFLPYKGQNRIWVLLPHREWRMSSPATQTSDFSIG